MNLPTPIPNHIIPNHPFTFLPSAKKVVDEKICKDIIKFEN